MKKMSLARRESESADLLKRPAAEGRPLSLEVPPSRLVLLIEGLQLLQPAVVPADVVLLEVLEDPEVHRLEAPRPERSTRRILKYPPPSPELQDLAVAIPHLQSNPSCLATAMATMVAWMFSETMRTPAQVRVGLPSPQWLGDFVVSNSSQQVKPGVLYPSDGKFALSYTSVCLTIGTNSLNRQDNISGLALRPGNANHSLLSPTPVLKRHPRLYTGKENHSLSFPTQPTTSNPYLTSHSSLGESSFNPLCAQPRESVGFRLYSSYDEDSKPPNAGFQPINTHSGYTTLHMPTRNGELEGYQSGQRHNGGVYDI